jgi:hypothetical protein
MNLLERIRTYKGLQNILLIGLFGLIFILPEESILGDIAILVIIFLIAYISSYIQVVPIWKGLLFSVLVTLIIVVVFLGTITFFPNISVILLMCIVAITGFLCTYLIG